jgi:hypothetical protein
MQNKHSNGLLRYMLFAFMVTALTSIFTPIQALIKRDNNKMQNIHLSRLLSYMFLTLVATLSLVENSIANPLSKLVDFAEQDGTMVSRNAPAIIQDQSGGFYTGGSMLMRGPKPKNLQPFTVQLPKFSYGSCNGSADFFFGGMSHISSAELTNFFKRIPHAAGAYAVKLLMKNVSPQIEDVVSYLETVARDINGLSLDQCAAAETIANGALGMVSNSNQLSCMTKGRLRSEYSDMAEATRKCKENPSKHDGYENSELESLLGDKFNLVWKALSKGSSASDKGFKELIMSVSGSVVGVKSDGVMRYTNLPSLVTDSDLLEKYIGARGNDSKVTLYECTDDKCLSPVARERLLKSQDTLYGRIEKIMEKLIEKAYNDKKGTIFTDEEQALISFSSVPIIALINQELAKFGDKDNITLRNGEFIEVICYDIMSSFLNHLVQKSIKEVKALEYAQLDNVVMGSFYDEAKSAGRKLESSKMTAYHKLQIILQTRSRLEQQEKELETMFSRLAAQEY